MALVRRIPRPDGATSATFDRILAMAARLFAVEAILVTIVDADTVWVKAGMNFGARSVPRSESFCQYTILGDDLFIVPDALRDARFRGPAYLNAGSRRFYGGAPIILGPGLRVGSLALLDGAPRHLTPTERLNLGALAAWVATEIRLGIVFRTLLEQGLR